MSKSAAKKAAEAKAREKAKETERAEEAAKATEEIETPPRDDFSTTQDGLDDMGEPEAPPEVKMVEKEIRCPRCKGSGTFVSNKTGSRAATAGSPLTDEKRTCPKCLRRKTVTIRITEEQAEIDKTELDRRIKVKTDKIKAAAAAEIKAAAKEEME